MFTMRSVRAARGGWAAVIVFGYGFGCAALAAESHIQSVEEDWELVLDEPDPDNVAPQVTIAMSPVGNVDGLYATFELNHRTQPGFAPGGLGLLLWQGETNLSRRASEHNDTLSTTGETIRWTQSMSLADGTLTFRVKDGTSTTWGRFGDSLRLDKSTDLGSLDQYSPVVSVKSSGIGFASNRVRSLALKKVRVTLSNGQELSDATVRYVHQKP